MSTPARPADLWGEHHRDGTALRSVDGRHRYYLTRDLDGRGVPLHFCMFNPSTATAVADDATLRRCLGYARHLEASSLHVWNLFSWRGDPGHPLRLPRAARPHPLILDAACCPGCGCTDDSACWPACWWVRTADGVRVCSSCTTWRPE